MPWFCMCVCPHVACVLQLSPGIWGLCMPHYYKHSCSLYPTARLENATHGHLSSCWFTGSQSQSCRGCPPPLGWGHAQNQKMDGWIGGYFTLPPSNWIGHTFHFLFASSPDNRPHFYFCFLNEEKITAAEGESKSLGHVLFLSKRQGKVIYYLLGPTWDYIVDFSQGLWLLLLAL